MDLVTGWTGRAACALQAALRMSNEAFAEHLGIAVRTVAAWHQKPGLRPRPEMQQVLDAALARAPAAAGERFAVLTGEPARAVSARTDDDGAAAEAEHRLITDPNISGALSRLDQLAAWEPGTARRTVAARLAGLDTRDLLDRASRRSRIGRDAVADALGKYYRCQAAEHGRYGARCGHDGPEIVTSVLTCPDWLDLGCPLTAGHDRLTPAGPAARADVPLDAGAADAAAQRLAETLVAGTRFVDMPLYRLTGHPRREGRDRRFAGHHAVRLVRADAGSAGRRAGRRPGGGDTARARFAAAAGPLPSGPRVGSRRGRQAVRRRGAGPVRVRPPGRPVPGARRLRAPGARAFQ